MIGQLWSCEGEVVREFAFVNKFPGATEAAYLA